jgi:hypothetical protein
MDLRNVKKDSKKFGSMDLYPYVRVMICMAVQSKHAVYVIEWQFDGIRLEKSRTQALSGFSVFSKRSESFTEGVLLVGVKPLLDVVSQLSKRMIDHFSLLCCDSLKFGFHSMYFLRKQLNPILPEESCISSTKNHS